MGITYTRGQIRTRVNDITRDTDTGIIAEAVKNRIISDTHREFVELTQCNRADVIFSIADASSDGVLEYDQNGNAPTLTLVDKEGYNYYTLSGCDTISSIERWITTGDGQWTQLRPADQTIIEQYGLLSGDTEYPLWYEMPNHDTFRLLKNLSSSAYVIKLHIVYEESVIDLITDEANPVATADDLLTGNVPLRYRKAIMYGAAAECFRQRGDARAGEYQQKYMALIDECNGKVHTDTKDKQPPI
ncbi:MAG: hypothetical protein DRP45_04835, partial [Candidatus Zixiibacteriota bacterium]